MKAKDIRAMAIEELDNELKEKKTLLFKKKFQHASAPISNPLEIRVLRRDIAKIITIMKEKKHSK